MATTEAIVINSDSEDEKFTQKVERRSHPSTVCRACKGICGALDNPVLLQSTTSTSPLDALFPRSRLRAPKRPLQTLVELFPVIEDVNREFRAMLATEYTEANIMRFVQYYIRTMRKLQEQVHKYPNKCRALSRNVSRTLLLIKKISTNVIEPTPYFMQKICELLAIYMFLELRYASSYTESKAKVVERIVNNILLHLESPDITYVLRIFAYIPFVGKEAYIVSRVFQRLIPIVVSGNKNEFNDRLYVQYLIAFYHWKDAETLPNCQENVIALANAFMKPKRTLKSSIVYARHLPCYEKRENATRYFLTNLVFFNDLRNASLLDGVAVMVDDTIDLSDEVETLCTDYSELELNNVDAKKSTVKAESIPRISGMVDLTDEEETPWLMNLARTARDREGVLPSVQRKNTPEVIDLDSSDEELWAVENRESAENEPDKDLSQGDENDSAAVSRRSGSSDVFLDMPEDSSSDVLLRVAMAESKNSCTNKKGESNSSETQPVAQKRLNFEGIIEKGVDSLHLSTSSTSSTLSSSSTPMDSSLPASFDVDADLNPSPSTSAAYLNASRRESSCGNETAGTSPVPQTNTSTSTSTCLTASPQTSTIANTSASESTSTSTSLSTPALTNTCASENLTESTPEIEMLWPENEENASSQLKASAETPEETESEKEAKGRALVADILTNFSEEISPVLENSAEDSETPQDDLSAINESIIDDSAAAPKEAVTLNLESYTNSFTCGEENDEFLRYYETTPPVKTYLRKTPKRQEGQAEKDEGPTLESNVAESNSTRVPDDIFDTPPSPAVEAENVATDEDNQCLLGDEAESVAATQSSQTADAAAEAGGEVEQEQLQETIPAEKESSLTDEANVLFSRKVISLREDDCSNGGTTPSYLKVPESVEVSQHGSNVVFSMQGRRLSSFPPLQVSSANDNAVPDFDADFFSESFGLQKPAPNNAAAETHLLTPAVTLPKTIIKTTEIESEKPTAKRRTVWFSDKNEVREIAPLEDIPEFAMQSPPLINISASIKRLSATKQQFLPSTSQQPQQSSATGTPASTSTSTITSLQHQQQQPQPQPPPPLPLQPPAINAYKSQATVTPSTPAINSILLKKSMPTMPTTTPPSPATATLKSAQEKDPHENDDNRTDDVLAAAEILANGIRLVQTVAPPTSLCVNGSVAVADAPPSPSTSPAPEPETETEPELELEHASPPPPQSAENLVETTANRSDIQQSIEASRNEVNEDVERPKVHIPLKRNVPMMASPTGSDGNDSVLEGFIPIRRPRTESIDEYEQFYRCHYSPSNMKRLLNEGHISLPLKKRRKLSEYSEENDFNETYDSDTVLNLKMPRSEVPAEKPKQTPSLPSKSFANLENDLKEISYPSEPMLSIAHFEKDGYREKSKDLSLKRTYPLVPPPRYSDVIRDCRPIAAHQQGLFQHPDQSQLQQASSNPALPQGMPTRPTINIVTARHTDHFGTINIINQENGTINIVTEENRDVNASTTNVYSSSQPVTNVNVGYQNASNMPAFVGPNAIQYSQAFLPKQQNCMYNVQARPPPPPTPEHIPPDFELQSIINLQNYHMNQTHINNFLHNRQINFQANKSIMNDALCGGSYQPNGVHNCSESAAESASPSPNQCEGSLSRKPSLIPRCGFCVDCKRRVTGMKVSSPDLTPLHGGSSSQLNDESSEGPSSPPRRRGRPRKPFAEPTNRVTRSTNRAGQKKKEDPCTDQFVFHVSETKSPSSAKKRRSASSYRSK